MSSSRRLSRSKNQRKVLSTTAAISAERLEDRVLMHGVGVEANTNFQKATANAPGAVNNKIDFIDIDAADATGLPMVGVSVSDGSAGEAGPNPGSFLVTRSGDTTSALTVNYALSGVATNGTDYQRLGGSVVIP